MSTDVALTAYEYDCFRMQRGLEPKYHVMRRKKTGYDVCRMRRVHAFRVVRMVKDALGSGTEWFICADAFNPRAALMLITERLALMGVPIVALYDDMIRVGTNIFISLTCSDPTKTWHVVSTCDPMPKWEKRLLVALVEGSEPIWPRDRAAAAVAPLLRTTIPTDLIRTIFNFLKW